MATTPANLTKNSVLVEGGNDSIVIVKCLADIPGGRTLDMTGVALDTLRAGHVIIKKSTGEYAPLGVSSDAYAEIPSGASFVGVLKASVLASQPVAAIMTMGQMNAAASPYPITSAIKTGLADIQFIH